VRCNKTIKVSAFYSPVALAQGGVEQLREHMIVLKCMFEIPCLHLQANPEIDVDARQIEFSYTQFLPRLVNSSLPAKGLA
jgi:hypothetical protein